MNSQTAGVPPPAEVTKCVRCGAVYIDNHEGRAAHRTVFGHQPTDIPASAGATRWEGTKP